MLEGEIIRLEHRLLDVDEERNRIAVKIADTCLEMREIFKNRHYSSSFVLESKKLTILLDEYSTLKHTYEDLIAQLARSG